MNKNFSLLKGMTITLAIIVTVSALLYFFTHKFPDLFSDTSFIDEEASEQVNTQGPPVLVEDGKLNPAAIKMNAPRQPEPIDISKVTSTGELDKYLGEYVSFTGKWENAKKQSGMSNGYVTIQPDLEIWGGIHSYEKGVPETVNGYLTKTTVKNQAPSASADPKKAVPQEIPAGDYYHIEKNSPSKPIVN